MTTDVTAFKFLQLLKPVGTRIFPEIKKNIKEGMSDEDLVSLFDVACKKMDTMRPVDTVEETLSAMVHQNTVEVIPTWAEELRVEVTAIQKKTTAVFKDQTTP